MRFEPVAAMIDRLSMPISECGCYAWLGSHSRGYAKVRYTEDGVRKNARVARFLCDPVPEGLEVDHLCHQRWCVNPDHLDLVTHQENIRRQRTHRRATVFTCDKGHEYRIRKNGTRWCHECKMEYQRQYRSTSS
jgi:hypothetical protein